MRPFVFIHGRGERHRFQRPVAIQIRLAGTRFAEIDRFKRGRFLLLIRKALHHHKLQHQGRDGVIAHAVRRPKGIGSARFLPGCQAAAF